MLEKNPEKRISIKEILKNPLIKIEIEKVKTEFDCYEKLEGERSRQVSFQQYLKDKMQKEDSPKEITKTEINQYSSLKNKENVKTLSRWSSLPAKTFEIFNFFNSNDEVNINSFLN